MWILPIIQIPKESCNISSSRDRYSGGRSGFKLARWSSLFLYQPRDLIWETRKLPERFRLVWYRHKRFHGVLQSAVTATRSIIDQHRLFPGKLVTSSGPGVCAHSSHTWIDLKQYQPLIHEYTYSVSPFWRSKNDSAHYQLPHDEMFSSRLKSSHSFRFNEGDVPSARLKKPNISQSPR